MSSSSRSSAARGPAPGGAGAAPECGPVSELEAHLGYWLRVVSNHVSLSFKKRVEAQGVTVAEWVVLRALFDADSTKPSELASRLGLTRGAISKLVERLTAKDLIAVRQDARDGRAQIITLRASGRRLVPKLAALADENDEETFGHLNGAERALLRETLEQLATRLGLERAPLD